MKTSCLQENFSRALAIAGRAVATRPTLPVTQNALIVTNSDSLRISATNLEISISTSLPASIFEDGSISVPAKLLAEFVNSLRTDRVDLTMENESTQLNVVSGQSEANITGTPAHQFPPIPSIEDATVIQLDPEALRVAIQRTAFAASIETSRPILTGVELKFRDNQFTMSAADGFRLAVQQGKLATPLEEEFALVIPARTLATVYQLLADHHDSVELAVPKNRTQILFRMQGKESVELVSQILQGTFPDTHQLIPQSHSTRVVQDAPATLRAVRTAAIFARDNSNIIRMEMNTAEDAEKPNPTIKVSARSDQLGDEQEEMNLIDIEGDTTKIAFNSRYLVDIFSVLDKGQVTLETTSSSSPGVFRAMDSDDYIHIVMPMFVKW